MESDQIREAVGNILRTIARSAFDDIDALTGGHGVAGSTVARTIAEYGRTPVPPPAECLDLIDSVEIDGSVPQAWSVEVPLWTREEGRSDLTLQLTLVDLGDHFGVEIDDLHVM